MKAKRTTKRKKRVVIVTPTIETVGTYPNAGQVIWYDQKEGESFVKATLKYLKGWFR
jgi:hypothetical protein